MPNSPWTMSGSSISLVPVTTIIDGGSSTTNINYLTNGYKIALMGQYAAELAIKTTLDTLASTWSVSSTFYDNAVAAISTALIAAGAPANWATTWPDGTTSGPWPGIKTNLGNLWAQVATQRTALQSTISSYQAAAAQATAISTAAAATITKLNTMALTAPISAAWASTAKPGLPNGSYPAGSCWLSTDGLEFQVSVDGGSWKAVVVAATGLFGQVLTSQLTVANFDNLIPNPNSEQTAPVGGWPSGAYEGMQLWAIGSTYAFSGSNVRGNYGPDASTFHMPAPPIPCSAGDSFYFEAQARVSNNGASPVAAIFLMMRFTDHASNYVDSYSAHWSTEAWGKITVSGTAQAGATWVELYYNSTSLTGQWVAVDAFYARRMADASLIVDGSITTAKIVAGGISANVITTGVLNAANVSVTNLNASNITTGVLSATKVQFVDGSALTTASRVITAKASPSINTNFTTTPVPIPAFAFNGPEAVTSAGASDVYNISAFLKLTGIGGVNTTITVEVCIDGATGSPQGVVVVNAPTSGIEIIIPYFLFITGLSAGPHTFQFYCSAANNTGSVNKTSYAVCQRIF